MVFELNRAFFEKAARTLEQVQASICMVETARLNMGKLILHDYLLYYL